MPAFRSALRLTFALVTFVSPTVAIAQPGTGLLWTDFGPSHAVWDDRANGVYTEITYRHDAAVRAYGLAVDPKLRLLTLAEWRDPVDDDLDCAVTRRVRNARVVDMEFGEELEGTRRIALDIGGDGNDTCLDIEADALSRPVVAGFADGPSDDAAFVLRLRSQDGALDPTFSADGIFSLHNLVGFGGDESRFVAVAVDPSRRVLACGSVVRGTDRNMLLMRLTESGSLDTSFNGTGWREIDWNGGGTDADACDAIELLPDGRIALAGTTLDPAGEVAFGLVLLEANGAFDGGFSGDGRARIDDLAPSTEPDVADLAYDASRQRLVVAATAFGAGLAAGQLLAVGTSGILDPSFDGDGRRTLRFSDFGVFGNARELGATHLERILMRSDGRFYLAGTHFNSISDELEFGASDAALARLLADGDNDDAPLHGFSGDGVAFQAYAQHGHRGVPNEARLVVGDRVRDAVFYRGNVLLLSDTNRYPDGVWENSSWPLGPIAPTVAAIVADRIDDLDFEFDGLEEPDTAFPGVAVPGGFGRYCSVRHPVSGGWGLLPQGGSDDPCQQMLDGDPELEIERSGLYSILGSNDVLAHCAGGYLEVHSGFGTAPFDAAAAAATGEVHCVFTVAPRSLPVFDRPYSGAHLAATAQSYNHDGYNIEIDVSDFGETPAPGHPFAHYVDLNGRQMCNAQNGHQAGFGVLNGVDEPAVDIGVGSDQIALAVAPGRVAWAVPRYVPYATPVGLDPHQREVFVRHRIGSGLYREEFTLFYAHMSDTRVRRGDIVAVGAQLGRIGNTGASGGDHLHLAALRHRNLSFRQSWEHGYAFAGFDDDERLRAASFDPWGWRGPAGTDPWATRFRNVPGRPLNSGSWSPNLWKAGEAPTME